jgi:hypothetical protein
MSGGLLTADQPEELHPLLDIANALFAELTVFGRAAQTDLETAGERQKRMVTTYLERRRLPLYVITAVLEQQAGLRFAGAHLPYRHNLATWPDRRPLAGYTDTDSLTPFQWMQSFVSNWGMVTTGDDPSDESGAWETHRVLRSALWVCHFSGLTSAIDYIFDLVDGGHVSYPPAAARAASYLLKAHAHVGSDGVVPRLMGGAIPDSRKGWALFLPTVKGLNPKPLSPSGRMALERLITRGWELVARTRDAATLDDWLSSIEILGGALQFIRQTVAWSMQTVPTGVLAILSQLEELGADATSALVSMEIGGVQAFCDYERDLRQQLQRLGDTTGQRFLRERLLLPSAILDSDDTPETWTAPSWRIALPWALNHTWLEDPDLIQPASPAARGTSREELERIPRAALDLTISLLDNGPDTKAARATLLDFLGRYPWSDAGYSFLSLTHWIDRDYPAAMSSLVRAIVMRPDRPAYWESLRDVVVGLGLHRAANLIEEINRPLTNLARKHGV